MFQRSSRLDASTAPFEYLPKTASTEINRGQALITASGRLVPCGSTDAPEFIAQSSSPSHVTYDNIAVERVTELDEFETTLSVAGATLNIGDRVTIATGAMEVTATTTDGVFMLTTSGGALGAKVRGMFRR